MALTGSSVLVGNAVGIKGDTTLGEIPFSTVTRQTLTNRMEDSILCPSFDVVRVVVACSERVYQIGAYDKRIGMGLSVSVRPQLGSDGLISSFDWSPIGRNKIRQSGVYDRSVA